MKQTPVYSQENIAIPDSQKPQTRTPCSQLSKNAETVRNKRESVYSHAAEGDQVFMMSSRFEDYGENSRKQKNNG